MRVKATFFFVFLCVSVLVGCEGGGGAPPLKHSQAVLSRTPSVTRPGLFKASAGLGTRHGKRNAQRSNAAIVPAASPAPTGHTDMREYPGARSFFLRVPEFNAAARTGHVADVALLKLHGR